MFEGHVEWLDSRALRTRGRSLSGSTLRTTRERLRAMAKHTGADSEVLFATQLADRASVCSLLDWLYVTHQPGTVRGDLIALRAFGEYAIAKGWVTSLALVATDAPRGRRRSRLPVVYTHQECELLIQIARSRELRLWALVTLCVDSGCRIGEALGVRREQFAQTYFAIPTAKNGDPRLVMFSARLRDEVFTERHLELLGARPFPWAYASVRSRLVTLCRIAGIDYRGWHAFRHTKATELLVAGVPIHAVSKLLGHSDLSTTARTYDHTSPIDFGHYLG